MNFAIVCESTCTLPEETIEKFRLNILPLSFRCDDKEYSGYVPGKRTDFQGFYRMLRDGKEITTSLPNLNDSEKTIRELLDQGKDILYLGFSSALSGTYHATDNLLQDLKKEYPRCTIRSVETLAASGGQGLLVYHAIKKAEEGLGVNEVADWVIANRLHLAHWFTVDDLMFLFRGGRVAKSSALVGTVLSVKPVMHVDNEGHLTPVHNVRGRKKSLNSLVEHMKETALPSVSEQPIFITHGDCLEDAEYVAEKVREEFGVSEIVINYVDPVIGAHSGPGTVALFFMADLR